MKRTPSSVSPRRAVGHFVPCCPLFAASVSSHAEGHGSIHQQPACNPTQELFRSTRREFMANVAANQWLGTPDRHCGEVLIEQLPIDADRLLCKGVVLSHFARALAPWRQTSEA